MSVGALIAASLLLAQGSADLEARYRAGARAVEQGRAYEALELLGAVAERDPGYRDVQVLLGKGCLMAGLLLPAKQHFERALSDDPENGQIAFLLGVSLYEAARYYEATGPLGRAHDRMPANPLPLIYRGRAHLKLGREREARRDVERALALAPHEPLARAALAEIEVGAGSFAAAEATLAPLLAVPHLAVEARVLLGRARLQAGRPQEAIPPLREALASVPDRSDALYLLAQALLRSGEAEAGREALERFRDVAAREERIRVLEVTLRAERDDVESRLELARLLLGRGRADRALPHVGELQRLLGEADPRVRALSAEVERLRGDR